MKQICLVLFSIALSVVVLGAQSDEKKRLSERAILEQLVKNQFKLGADAFVTAGPVGRDASAATDLRCARRS